jgi:hypothetical protein
MARSILNDDQLGFGSLKDKTIVETALHMQSVWADSR